MKRATPSAGFTLAELIVVILVLGILAAVFVPRSGNNAIVLSGQAEQFAADIRYAQSLAMTQGWNGASPRRYRINFTATSYGLFDASGVAITTPGGSAGWVTIAGGATITPLPASGLPNNLVAFDGVGRPYTDAAAVTPLAATATISMTLGGATRTLQVFPETGMVRLQ